MRRRRLGPLLTRLLAAPARLHDWHAGWIFGRRFLVLTHVGRRSGRRYQTMLEVVGENPGAGEMVVMAGLGRSAQWYQNLLAGKAVEVAIASERFAPAYRLLDEHEAAAVLGAYERRHRRLAPAARRVLSWLAGWRYDSSDAARRRLVSDLPMVALRAEARHRLFYPGCVRAAPPSQPRKYRAPLRWGPR